MTDVVIEVENLSKRYVLGQIKGDGLRHAIEAMLRSPLKWLWNRRSVNRGTAGEEFWALRDLNVQIRQGEVVGIIGRNGAGKSTLLKILSRITDPTGGRVRLRGRVASLLEVGTGFHPELTGRENIFLNGAILGMGRNEIRRKFDEIVAFSEIEKFIDTPVKRYSSGMYVRLAFAVAAHLEPDILIIDEVLAVGDSSFQKKCLGKMGTVAREGRTVLFVSHNLGAVSELCHRGVYLKEGRVAQDGPVQQALATYVSESQSKRNAVVGKVTRPTITDVRIDREKLVNGVLSVLIDFASPFPLNPPLAGVVVSDTREVPIFGSNARMHTEGFVPVSASQGTVRFESPPLPLHTGQYLVSAWLGDPSADYDSWISALSFDFISPFYHAERPPDKVIGPLNLVGKWSVTKDAQMENLPATELTYAQ